MVSIILYYYNMRSKASLILLVTMALIIRQVVSPRRFCSVMCSKKNCTDTTSSGCSACNSYWNPVGANCVPNSTNGYYLHNKTPDLGGTLAVSSPYATNACGPYSLYGLLQKPQTLTVTSPGITVSFYQMIVYFGILTIDSRNGGDWSKYTYFYLNFVTGGSLNPIKLRGQTYSERDEYCSNDDKDEQWNKISQSYSFGTPNVSLSFNIYNNQSESDAKWGMKQFIIIYRTCNIMCKTCFGPLISQCYQCVYNAATNSSWLSGTTCNQTCLSQYGFSTNISFCIRCDVRCTDCYDSQTNCFACTKFGKYISYLYASNFTCMNPCPTGYFANKTSQTCDPCNVNCTSCIYYANYCTACNTGNYWYKYFCYNPCPAGSYLQSNLINCTTCDLYCETCIGPSTLCTVCQTAPPYIAYLYNTTNSTGSCLRTCPQGYYASTANQTNLCLPCNASCYYCTGFPSPCQQCTPGYYLYNQICTDSCPANLFASNATGSGQCLDCNIVCVDLTLSMSFANALNNQIYIDMVFSQNMDFTTFDMTTFQTITIDSNNMHYTIDMFNVSYAKRSKSSYRIYLKPAGYVFLYNVTFTVTTRTKLNVTDYSAIGMPFKQTNYLKSASLNWFLIKGPPFTSLQENIMTSFSTLSQKTNNFLSLPYVQEIKKSGVFNLLFSGAQITSCSMLSNQIQSQNLYQGVRFWATFVFFDAPAYEQISNQTKNFISPSVQSRIRNSLQLHQQNFNQRNLFSTDTMYWRFQRTGQTSFFIYDCYIPVFLIFLCWISLLILYKIKKTRWYSQHSAKVYSAVHKIHEITMLYITMAAIVQFTYFQTTSAQRFISAILCVVFNIYFIIYYLYIYYDMLKYPLAEVGNAYYDYYVNRYGGFLKNIRYEQYDIHQKWSPRHWLRPYNFHFLSYYKKFLMIITLPLFYSTQYAQMGILFVIQLGQVLRVSLVWPFASKKRNYLRLSLQIALGLFFLANIIQITLVSKIQSGNINEMGQTISFFYGVGWTAFLLCFYFNVTHAVVGVYDFISGLRSSSRSKMDYARKKYYYQKIKQYEKQNEGASKQLVNKWVKLGNLNNKYYGELSQINIRIQEYCMRMTLGKFEISVKKITQLKMLKKYNRRKKNNTVTTKRIEKKGVLAEHKNPKLYELLHGYYQNIAKNHIETVILKTFMNVFQPDFAQDEDIPFDRNKMFQKVDLISYDNESVEQQIPEVMEDFPVPEHLLENF